MYAQEGANLGPQVNVREVLSNELYLWCLRSNAAEEIDMPHAINEPPYIEFPHPELTQTCAEQIRFYGHAVAQAGERDDELGDDLAANVPIAKAFSKAFFDYWRTRKLPRLIQIRPGEEAFQRHEYHTMLDSQRRATGNLHLSPYGIAFAAAIVREEVVLPADPEIVRILDEHIATKRPQLYKELVAKAAKNERST